MHSPIDIIVIFVIIVLIVCAIHSYLQQNVPRKPFVFHIELDKQEE